MESKMAEILVKYNTIDKSFEITKDGKRVSDVRQVTFYNYDGNGSVEIETSTMNEDDAIYTCTKIYANEQGEDVVEERVKENTLHELVKALRHNKIGK